MEFLQNITFRRTRTQSDSNAKYNNSCNSVLNETLDCSDMDSLPDKNIENNYELVTSLKGQIEKLMYDLNNAHKKIETLSAENCNLKQRKNKTPTKKGQQQGQQTQSTEKVSTNMLQHEKAITEYPVKKQESEQLEQEERNRKLCILNGCNYNGTLNIIDHTFGQKFYYCQYMKRNISLKELMSGIKNKLSNFDVEDYCIIMIGEREFRKNVDSNELVKFIRETLIEITKTNTILYVPPIYNYRVEMINNLLHKDIDEHRYAYLFDTNYDLTYDMLSNKTGKINRSGIKCIFGSIFNRILIDLKTYFNKTTAITTDSSKQISFFRDIE